MSLRMSMLDSTHANLRRNENLRYRREQNKAAWKTKMITVLVYYLHPELLLSTESGHPHLKGIQTYSHRYRITEGWPHICSVKCRGGDCMNSAYLAAGFFQSCSTMK